MFELTQKEIEFRDERAARQQVIVSAFPFEKEVKDFDFSYQPSVNKTQILDLETLRFLENKAKVISRKCNYSYCIFWKNDIEFFYQFNFVFFLL